MIRRERVTQLAEKFRKRDREIKDAAANLAKFVDSFYSAVENVIAALHSEGVDWDGFMGRVNYEEVNVFVCDGNSLEPLKDVALDTSWSADYWSFEVLYGFTPHTVYHQAFATDTAGQCRLPVMSFDTKRFSKPTRIYINCRKTGYKKYKTAVELKAQTGRPKHYRRTGGAEWNGKERTLTIRLQPSEDTDREAGSD